MNSIRIRVLLFEQDGWWCAQCLEYDIAAQATTESELHKELANVLLTHVLASAEFNQKPFSGLPAAPQDFFEIYDKASSGAETGEQLLGGRDFESIPCPLVLPSVVWKQTEYAR